MKSWHLCILAAMIAASPVFAQTGDRGNGQANPPRPAAEPQQTRQPQERPAADPQQTRQPQERPAADPQQTRQPQGRPPAEPEARQPSERAANPFGDDPSFTRLRSIWSKHKEHQAKLERLKAIFEKKKDAKRAAEVDELIKQERARVDRQHEKARELFGEDHYNRAKQRLADAERSRPAAAPRGQR